MDHQMVAGSTLDRDLELLASRYRRLVIRCLVGTSHTASFADLLDHLLERTSGDRDDVRIGLRHTHLPKLEAHGLVDYDPRSAVVRYHPDDRVERVMECLPGE